MLTLILSEALLYRSGSVRNYSLYKGSIYLSTEDTKPFGQNGWSVRTWQPWLDCFWINNSRSLSKVSLVTSSTEYLNHLKIPSFPHFLFPRFSVWMDAIINISSSLTSTVGVLKFNAAGELKFNYASESWHDDVILVG